jgi:hypothetical protein
MSDTVRRQPSGIVGPVFIEPKRAPLWQGDHGMDDGTMPWNPLPKYPGAAKVNKYVEPVLKKAPFWTGDHGQVQEP